MACTWLREFSSCSCVPSLPGPAWVLLSKIYKPFAGSLYIRVPENLLISFFHSAWTGEGERIKQKQIHGPSRPDFGVCA